MRNRIKTNTNKDKAVFVFILLLLIPTLLFVTGNLSLWISAGDNSPLATGEASGVPQTATISKLHSKTILISIYSFIQTLQKILQFIR